MKRNKKINKLTILLIICLMPIILLLVFGIVTVMHDYGYFENYSGWKKVSIPTESELVATMKIPEEWNFIVENGRIKIKNTQGDTVAVECYEDWSYNYYNPSTNIRDTNYQDLDINSELPDQYRVIDNYEFVAGGSASCFLYKITTEFSSNYALEMYIMDKENVKGVYCLFIVFDSEIDVLKMYDKFQKSYKWGGILN